MFLNLLFINLLFINLYQFIIFLILYKIMIQIIYLLLRFFINLKTFKILKKYKLD